jgi:hypothetical protein
MDRVSDEWLDEQISLYDHLGDEISDLGKERCAALVELRDRRAADDPEDAEYASYEASKAQAEQLAAMTAGQLERLGSGVMFELMRRAAEREQAALEPRKLDEVTCAITVNPGAYEAAMAVAGSKIAEFIRAKQPKPRKPAKWERRLEMMRGTLEKEEIGERRWQCSLCFEGHTFYGPTAKAAVEAAWKAWKEEQGE